MSISKGIQTTEFALTVVVNVAGIVGSLSGVIPASWALLIMAGINSVYGILRAVIKINDPSYNVPIIPQVTITGSSGNATTTVQQ